MGEECLEARAAMLDLDGVLADSWSAIERSWEDWAQRHGIPRQQVMAHVVGRRSEDVVRMLAPHLDAEAESVWLEDREARYAVTACPGAVEFVAALDGVPWAVVTSGHRMTAVGRLRAIGIPIPQVLVTASDVARGKPDPEGYLAASGALGVPARECVVVEDSRAGVMAAKQAGARVIGIKGTALAGAAVDVLVRSLGELRVHADGAGLVFSVSGDDIEVGQE
jgi:mannitol-1-/sugar-/sorbitol-6-phosphatase